MKKSYYSLRAMAPKRKSIHTHQASMYDHSMGAIRVRDSADGLEIAPSFSPAKLTRSMRRNIKKQGIAEIV